MYEKVWGELVADIAREAERAVSIAEEDPLGALLSDAREAGNGTLGSAARRAADLSRSSSSSSSSGGVARKRQAPSPPASKRAAPRVAVAGAPTEDPVAAMFKRTATQPRDVWSKTGRQWLHSSSSLSSSSPGGRVDLSQPNGPECPRCSSRDTARLGYEDRGRKAEVWGSADVEDRCGCRSCGHRWVGE